MIELFRKYGISLKSEDEIRFLAYYEFLIQKNSEFNLTAITDRYEVIVKHFLDSSILCPYLKKGTILDVGSGAGFPGMPIKIVREDMEVTLLDSLNKRVNFLNETIDLLKLSNVSAVHARIEDYKEKEKFDYVVSRAVSQTNTLLEYLLPFVKVGGYAVLYKSKKFDEEIMESHKALEILGGKIEKIEKINIEEINAERYLVFIKKIKSSPKNYPRGKNLPKIKPIIG